MPGCRLACGDQRRLTGSGSALEVVLHDYALYTNPRLLTLLYQHWHLLHTHLTTRYPVYDTQQTVFAFTDKISFNNQQILLALHMVGSACAQ